MTLPGARNAKYIDDVWGLDKKKCQRTKNIRSHLNKNIDTKIFLRGTLREPQYFLDWQQARSQVLKFEGSEYISGGEIFVFIICLKEIFLGTAKRGGTKKIW